MSEIKKVENGVTTKYKGVWNATICVEKILQVMILQRKIYMIL